MKMEKKCKLCKGEGMHYMPCPICNMMKIDVYVEENDREFEIVVFVILLIFCSVLGWMFWSTI